MKHLISKRAAFAAAAILCCGTIFPLKASARPVAFPASQVCDPNGSTIGCLVGGTDCMIIIDVPITEGNPGSGGVNVDNKTEVTVDTDLYQSNASNNDMPTGYQNVQSAVYSKTGRDITSDFTTYYPSIPIEE